MRIYSEKRKCKRQLSAVVLLGFLLSSFSLCIVADEVIVADKASFGQAVEKLKAGDSLVLANGVWSDFEMLFYGIGTKEKPITLKAEEKGKVIISGRSNLRLAGEHLVVSGLVFKNGYTPTSSVISFRKSKPKGLKPGESASAFIASNSRLTNIVIDGFSNPERFETDYWVTLYGKNNRVDHNHFEGKGNKGVLLAVRLDTLESQENRHLIDHNYFGPRAILGANGGETIRIGTSHYSLTDSFTRVEHNYFDRCDGELEIISVKSGKNRIANNTFFESRGTLTLRHGNGNIVEENVFFGNGVDHTGGIRVINKQQVIRNNYMEGLAGYRFGGALVVMNGVPNSSINRYHQVDGAVIENNSMINNGHIQLAAGSDQERSAVPINSHFVNNLIVNKNRQDVFTVYDDISGIHFENNILHKVKEPSIQEGFKSQNVGLKRNKVTGLMYPKAKLLDEVGRQVGIKAGLVPTSKKSTGADWYAKENRGIQFKTGRTVAVKPGLDTLTRAVSEARSGDILLLEAGDYMVSRTLLLNKAITLRSKKKNKAKLAFGKKALFELADGGAVHLDGLHISGHRAPDDLGNSVIRTSRYSMLVNYQIVIENTIVENLNVNRFFNVVDVSKSTMADRIAISGSTFKNISGAVLKLDKETDDYGIYNAEYVDIRKSTFTDIQGALIEYYRGGTDESTFGPHFTLLKSELNNVGLGAKNKSASSILLHGVQVTKIKGNRFNSSAPINVFHTVGEPRTDIQSNKFDGEISIEVKELYSKKENTAVLSGNVSMAKESK